MSAPEVRSPPAVERQLQRCYSNRNDPARHNPTPAFPIGQLPPGTGRSCCSPWSLSTQATGSAGPDALGEPPPPPPAALLTLLRLLRTPGRELQGDLIGNLLQGAADVLPLPSRAQGRPIWAKGLIRGLEHRPRRAARKAATHPLLALEEESTRGSCPAMLLMGTARCWAPVLLSPPAPRQGSYRCLLVPEAGDVVEGAVADETVPRV